MRELSWCFFKSLYINLGIASRAKDESANCMTLSEGSIHVQGTSLNDDGQ
jgi:hypothetical protein